MVTILLSRFRGETDFQEKLCHALAEEDDTISKG